MFKMCFEDGFVHADLHPGNMVVKDAGTLVIFDAGLAKLLARGRADPVHRYDQVHRDGHARRHRGAPQAVPYVPRRDRLGCAARRGRGVRAEVPRAGHREARVRRAVRRDVRDRPHAPRPSGHRHDARVRRADHRAGHRQDARARAQHLQHGRDVPDPDPDEAQRAMPDTAEAKAAADRHEGGGGGGGGGGGSGSGGAGCGGAKPEPLPVVRQKPPPALPDHASADGQPSKDGHASCGSRARCSRSPTRVRISARSRAGR